MKLFNMFLGGVLFGLAVTLAGDREWLGALIPIIPAVILVATAIFLEVDSDA